MKPRIVRTEKLKPKTVSTEAQEGNPDASPGVVQTKEIKPTKPTTEK